MYEVDPLKCPKCGGEMRIVGFIEREDTMLIRIVLSTAGLWKELAPRPPPPEPAAEPSKPEEPVLDYEFFAQNCI